MPSDASPHAKIDNPWLREFLAASWQEIAIAQVLVRRVGAAFELRHVDDANIADLKSIALKEARALSNFNAEGAFRPLKTTRDLKRGWILRILSAEELEEALQAFYPNALADRHSLAAGLSITNYREFTARQTGMYRITAMLDDTGVARVVESLCTTVCLKQRLWTCGNIAPDPIETKSAIPCLEPCAVLLEAARKQVRAVQEAERAGEPASKSS